MGKRTVHVANLRIRIPRGLGGQAVDLASGLGREILRSVADATASETRSKKVGAIDTVVVRAARTDVPDLQKQAAAQVAQSLRKRFD
ncbi:hypothetical protein HLB44_32535 [Aquincola sp. S2]|uniref:Uncharacterized protein n=1 Tax=Pseudaquabacterium terrae TaxID=2732868 RepID=A0ABX2ETB9_9BURK|nr:hypothetical protein [Aquabacterium terrae]NRF71726.1 hypothetical protein [Aquabacterium terrae]